MSIEKSCKTCREQREGYCYYARHPACFRDDVYQVSESGDLLDVIRSALDDCGLYVLREIEEHLESKISELYQDRSGYHYPFRINLNFYCKYYTRKDENECNLQDED